ncbi:MAG: host attachment protein [Sulfuricurvum sp.]
MSTKLIIVADLQRFKLFTGKVDPMGRESLELLQNIESLETHQQLGESVSDQQGNFQGVSSNGSINASGSGEDHNIELEKERRRLKEIAKQISTTLQEHSHTGWYFSAPKAINNQIIELLDPAIVKSMKVNLHADLTKIPTDQLLEHFTK